jgi:hypothetical protein
MSSQSKPSVKDREQKAIFGIDKHFGSATSVTMNGSAHTAAEMKSLLQSHIDSVGTADTAKATWQKAVKDERAARAQALALLRVLKAYLLGTYGPAAVDLLADFGVSAPKPRKVAVKTKATAVDKTLATRAARHTMGAKQKKQVKGTVTPPTHATTVAQPAPQAPAGGKPPVGT